MIAITKAERKYINSFPAYLRDVALIKMMRCRAAAADLEAYVSKEPRPQYTRQVIRTPWYIRARRWVAWHLCDLACTIDDDAIDDYTVDRESARYDT